MKSVGTGEFFAYRKFIAQYATNTVGKATKIREVCDISNKKSGINREKLDKNGNKCGNSHWFEGRGQNADTVSLT